MTPSSPSGQLYCVAQMKYRGYSPKCCNWLGSAITLPHLWLQGQFSCLPQVLRGNGSMVEGNFLLPILPQDRWVIGAALPCPLVCGAGSPTLPPTGLSLLCCPGNVQDLLSCFCDLGASSPPVAGTGGVLRLYLVLWFAFFLMANDVEYHLWCGFWLLVYFQFHWFLLLN